MKTGLKITKNTLSLIGREALNKGALFVLLILIGRFLGKEALGRYSLALAISQIFFFGTDLGLNTLVIRDVAKDRSLAGKFVINIEVLRLALGLVTMGMIWLTALALGAKGETAAVIYLCGLSYFFVNIINIYTSVFRAFERMELEILVAFIKAVIFLPAAIWLLFGKFGLVAIFNVFLVSNVLALIAAKIILLKQIKMPPAALDIGFLKTQLTKTLPLWISQLFEISYLKIAPLLLFRLRGEEAVGLYNAGFIIVDGLWVLAICFASALFPMISRLYHESLPEAKKEYFNGLRSVLLIFLPLGGALVLGAKFIVPLCYGGKFIEIVPLFRIFAAASILVALTVHNSLTIIAIDKQHVLPFINGVGLLINFLLNVFFIMRIGYTGSAYALIISEAVVLISMVAVLQRSFFNVAPAK